MPPGLRGRRRVPSAAQGAGQGLFNVVTFNCASWRVGLSAALAKYTDVSNTASVVCLQELRVASTGRPAAHKAGRDAGWDLTMATCTKGPGGRPSVGVGVCCKRFLRTGADVDPSVHNALIVPARAIATPVRVRGLTSPVLVISVYMVPGIGMKGASAQALAAIMTFAESWGAAYVVAGDFNAPAEKVRGALVGHGALRLSSHRTARRAYRTAAAAKSITL